MAALILDQKSPQLWSKLASINLPTAVFVTPTDTLYGLGTAYGNTSGIERIRTLKERRQDSFIVLVRDWRDVSQLAQLNAQQESTLHRYWPGAISFILKVKDSDKTLALRMPQSSFLIKLMDLLGQPIISTSCNLSGFAPLTSIKEAVELFGEKVDVYVEGQSPCSAVPSTLVDLTQSVPMVLREGAVPFPTFP